MKSHGYERAATRAPPAIGKWPTPEKGCGPSASTPSATRGSLEAAIAVRDRWRAENVVGAASSSLNPSSPEVCPSVLSGGDPLWKGEPWCTLCGVAAIVHCAVDLTFLCPNCDDFVHGANLVSSRHLRTRRLSTISDAERGAEKGLSAV